MKPVAVAIIGAGPYGLSLAAHLAAHNIEHRLFGTPMRFWSHIAAAGERRFLKSFCFGTDLSIPRHGFTFADYSRPRGLETFEPCSIADFAAYGRWFQHSNVPWVEPFDVVNVASTAEGFRLRLSNDALVSARQLIIATGLSRFAYVPAALAGLPREACTHTAEVDSFAGFTGKRVAVIGAGQSALEAAALLNEVGAHPTLLVRDDAVLWHTRVSADRNVWRKLRSPISKLGSGPKAWTLSRFPGAMHRIPDGLRTRFVRSHLPAEGAWWLRERVENIVPIRCGTTVMKASVEPTGVVLDLCHHDGTTSRLETQHVIAGSGYVIDVERLDFLDVELRHAIARIDRAPRLDATFETSVPGLRFVGPASALSFGPLFRFVVGADYSARVIAEQLATRSALAA